MIAITRIVILAGSARSWSSSGTIQRELGTWRAAVRRVRLLSQRVAFDPARDLRQAPPRWPACRGAACSHIIIRLLVHSPLRTKRPVFKVFYEPPER